MLHLNSLPLSFLIDNGLPKEDGFPGKYLAGVLHALIQLAGQDKTVEIWKAGKVSIESFVPKDQLNEFVTSNVRKVLFTISIRSETLSPCPSVTASFFCHVLKQRQMGHKSKSAKFVNFFFEFALFALSSLFTNRNIFIENHHNRYDQYSIRCYQCIKL